MSKPLVDRIDLLLTESAAATLAKTALVVTAPFILKFAVNLVTKLITRLTDTEDKRDYYRDLRDKIDSALRSKGFKYNRIIKSDPLNPGYGDTMVFRSDESPIEIKVHLDQTNIPIRITTAQGTETYSIDLPSYGSRNKNVTYTGIKFR